MWKIKTVVIMVSIAVVAAFPADENKLDKATKNDVTLNLVTSKSGEPENRISASIPKVSVTSSGTIGISSPEEEAPSKIPIELPSPPQTVPKAGTMFARFIDDVFQIPITVLQSVTKLLTNPFRNKESSA